ncbi:MAG: acyl carrier protein [Bacillota bacterium]
MENTKMYNEVFMQILDLKENELGGEIVFSETMGWDSIGHMQLIAKLESEFDIFFDTEDILNFSSFEHGKVILKKYNIEIE